MEVLELQSLPGIRYSASLAQAGPTCQRLHTLVACGLSQLTLELLEHLPCLECLALNFCHADSVQGLCKLQKLRCFCLRGRFGYLLACTCLPGAPHAQSQPRHWRAGSIQIAAGAAV